jgi:2-polyprenyl-6-methoxyphenol hydroxylase-like FAD-dependent oxidoreductase
VRTLIVGSGPTGLLLGAALARRGHQVTSVDRDPGPTGDAWIRRGVMQFEHAHGFRPQVPMTLLAEWPEAYTSWRDLGARPVEAPRPAGSPQVLGVLSRRSTFERALRHAANKQPGLTLRTGGQLTISRSGIESRFGASITAKQVLPVWKARRWATGRQARSTTPAAAPAGRRPGDNHPGVAASCGCPGDGPGADLVVGGHSRLAALT